MEPAALLRQYPDLPGILLTLVVTEGLWLRCPRQQVSVRPMIGMDNCGRW